jgi:uncharacterized protein (TIGR02246 family)
VSIFCSSVTKNCYFVDIGKKNHTIDLMKKPFLLISFMVFLSPLFAEEPSPEIAGLRQSATDFVAAYNKKDAAAVAMLFAEQGEIVENDEVTSGRAAIQARYESLFKEDPRQIAIEVADVRLVAPTVAIEDGVYHISRPDDENMPPRSTAYTAVMVKNDKGKWQIASCRDVEDVTDAAGQLADLEEVLRGEWTSHTDQVEVSYAFGWDPTGKFLLGDILTTKADADPQAGTMRIGWNAAKKSIVSWVFDAEGGVIEGVWTTTEEGWMIRAEGTTANGEVMTANQKLTTEGKDTLVWSVTNRVIGGKKQPDLTMRIVRQAPEPAAAE